MTKVYELDKNFRNDKENVDKQKKRSFFLSYFIIVFNKSTIFFIEKNRPGNMLGRAQMILPGRIRPNNRGILWTSRKSVSPIPGAWTHPFS